MGMKFKVFGGRCEDKYDMNRILTSVNSFCESHNVVDVSQILEDKSVANWWAYGVVAHVSYIIKYDDNKEFNKG